jgi:hypothetical protein
MRFAHKGEAGFAQADGRAAASLRRSRQVTN